MIQYILFYVAVVVAAGAGGAIIVLLAGERRRRIRLFAAELAAAGRPARPRVTAALPVIDVTRPQLDPLPDDSLGLVRWQAYHDRDRNALPELETAATTGDLSYVRQQIDLDDFALFIEQQFYELLERTRASFENIGITA